MPIRLSGINSGLDTDAIVQELVSAYSLKTEKYEKQQTKLQWKQDAWKNLNTKIYGLYTNVSNLRFSTAYNLKRTTVSDATKASVTASSEAVTGTQKLQILSTAQASYITGGKLGDEVTSSSTMADLGYTGGETTIEVRTKGGDTTEINISQDSKISDIITQLKDAGLNANFDANNKRFFVSAKESGASNDFDLCATDANSQDVLSKLGLDISIMTTDSEGNKVFSSAGAAYQDAYDLYNAAIDAGYTNADGIADVTSYLTKMIEDYKTALDAEEATLATYQPIVDEYEALVAQRDARKAHNAMYSAFAKAGLSATDDGKGFASGRLYDMTKELYKTGEITEDDVEKYLKEHSEILLPDGKTAADVAKVLNENKDNMKLVAKYEGNVLSQKLDVLEEQVESGKASYDEAVEKVKDANANIASIKAKDYSELAELEGDALIAEIQEIAARAVEAVNIYNNTEPTESGAIKITGSDAKIILNGAEFTSSTNSFSINGLTIEAQAVTDGEISITTAVDTQGIYDKIKDFLSEYNSVINEITKLYNAESASDYEPLTDEEKDAMSDTEIEKWEDKIKSALLRRDTSLGTIMNAMVNSMSQSIEIDGQKLSLGTFGIQTLGFLNAAENEQYAYHIDGDEDDASSSGKTDKLMKAIQENPDQIMEFMQKLTSNLYSAIDSKMKSTELSSAYKVYNDKEIDSELKNIEELIEKWEDKVADEEDRYYKQFSNMEVALSKLQSQTNSLTGLLG